MHFRRLGCQELLIKPLAPNDNSKNQPYIAKDRSMLGFSLLPASDFEAKDRNMRARIDLQWLDDEGRVHPAPNAKLIQYTRYNPPEVRLSGFLQGCPAAPSELMNSRAEGRVLFLGVASRTVYAYAVGPDDKLAMDARELMARPGIERRGVMYAFSIDDPTTPITETIESSLLRVNEMGWIEGQKRAGGVVTTHKAQNAGGMTLESVLGVDANSDTAPDFLGWEIKAVETKKPGEFPSSKIATLITPSPTTGFYGEFGFDRFVRKYGYPAVDGTPDRINFGGVYRVGLPAERTGATLGLSGFSRASGMEVDGAIELRMRDGSLGAAWPFTGLLEKWNRKHAQTVYVPYEKNGFEYKFLPKALFCRGSDFGRFLAALDLRLAYYDPALKILNASTSGTPSQARHQFRTNLRDIGVLYEQVSWMSEAGVS